MKISTFKDICRNAITDGQVQSPMQDESTTFNALQTLLSVTESKRKSPFTQVDLSSIQLPPVF